MNRFHRTSGDAQLDFSNMGMRVAPHRLYFAKLREDATVSFIVGLLIAAIIGAIVVIGIYWCVTYDLSPSVSWIREYFFPKRRR